jgi:hypothetical protein
MKSEFSGPFDFFFLSNYVEAVECIIDYSYFHIDSPVFV